MTRKTTGGRKKATQAKKRPQNYILRDLKERGWTDTMVRRILGEPDELRPNPHYNCAAPMRCYSVKRVKRAERTKAFRVAAEMAKKRQDQAALTACCRAQQTSEFIQSLPITLPQLGWDELVRKACDHYNAFHETPEEATPDSDERFLERICVNYLRHGRTQYDQWLCEMERRVGADEARLTIKRRVLRSIAAAYPLLADECEDQESHAVDRWDDMHMYDFLRNRPDYRSTFDADLTGEEASEPDDQVTPAADHESLPAQATAEV